MSVVGKMKGVHGPSFVVCQCHIQQVGRTLCDYIVPDGHRSV